MNYMLTMSVFIENMLYLNNDDVKNQSWEIYS